MLGKALSNAQEEVDDQSAGHQKLLQNLESERLLLQTLIDNVPDHLFQKDREGRYLLVNLSLLNAVGATCPKDVIGKTDWDIFPTEIAESFIADDQLVVESGKPLFNREQPLITASGSITWVLTTKVPLFDDTGRVTGLVGICRDITMRKELEKKSQQLERLVQCSDDAIVGFDLNRRITVWNRGAEKLYGYTAEEMIGAPTSPTIPLELEKEARLMRERVMCGGQVTKHETTRLRKDGSRIIVSLTLSAIREADGKIVGVASTARDISQGKQAEKALRDSEEHFRSIVTNASLGIFHSTVEGKMISANPIFAKMLGYA